MDGNGRWATQRGLPRLAGHARAILGQSEVRPDVVFNALHGRMGDLADSAFGMATLFALDRHGAKQLLDGFAGATDKIIVLDRYVASNAAYSAARLHQDADGEVVRWVADRTEHFLADTESSMVLVDPAAGDGVRALQADDGGLGTATALGLGELDGFDDVLAADAWARDEAAAVIGAERGGDL